MNVRLPFPVRGALCLLPIVLLAACATAPSPDDTTTVRADWPERPEFAAGATTYRVDPAASELRVRVAPAGSLARLGHHHVIGGPVWSGEFVLGEPVLADLSIDVTRLEVDRVAWRREEGFEPLDDEAIEGTRRNLLGPKVLDAGNHPTIEIRSVEVTGPDWQADVTARVRVRDEITEWRVPVVVQRDGERLTVAGAVDLDQTALGLEPFSAAGGALRVADRMRVRFRIVAERIEPGQ
ncbi:YceI family protein [Wenzhouxiangella sp. XN79A]|uniref:YceI family protein n=1 Tax=Wenzhouxiangella sp. XN79A TaxID=2724193 RepID=UPI00144A6BA4|nr:YceI family protein [Wenzhouxiangella sp. XN79A]NKI36309.1 YceI family protein [Wenzhouxiangella sp. XN79A]